MGFFDWLFPGSNVEEGGGKTNWAGEPVGPPTPWWSDKPQADDNIDPAGWTW